MMVSTNSLTSSSSTALPRLLEVCYLHQDSIGLHSPIQVGEIRADRSRTRTNFPIPSIFCGILVLRLVIVIHVSISATAQPVLPAFPGAEGFGTQTPGGRSGQVIQVTNLNDAGPGSLRAALEASEPRIVVFRVGGTILLQKPIEIKNPYLTLAGQSAPGDGIQLRGEGITIATHDVVIRNIRIRIGDEGVPTNSRDALNISATFTNSDVYNVVIDHCSISWAIDENLSTWASTSKPFRKPTMLPSSGALSAKDSMIPSISMRGIPHLHHIVWGHCSAETAGICRSITTC